MTRALILLGLTSLSALAAPTVEFRKGTIQGGAWTFSGIVSPRRGDLAEQAKLTLVTGALSEKSAPLAEFANGTVSSRGNDPAQAVFLGKESLKGALLMMDLGSVQEIHQLNTFSSHEYPQDGGARGPQVYTVYGSAETQPDAKDLSHWTKIASVDTRPNKTGEDWGGIYGVQIADGNKALGKFRHLLWDIRPTGSPKASSPASTQTFFTEIDVHGPNTIEDAQPAQLASATGNVERFVLVYKTHFDIGYTQLARDVIKNYRTTMIDKALEVADENAKMPKDQQFVWTVPGWPMKEILADWPGQTATRQARIEKAFRDGRFTVHALPYTPHIDVTEPEELVRSLIYSSNLNRSIDKPLPRAAKLTDVPCQPWLVPTVLKHAGVEFLHIGCNGHSSPAKVPVLFWWEGPDGSRVLTYYSADGYGTNLLPSPGWPHKTWLSLIATGDNHGPPQPEELKRDIARIREKFPNAKITIGGLDDFADALLAEKPQLPIVHADMPDTWIHGPMSSPIGMKLARNTLPRLAAAESLGTMLQIPDQATPIARAYEMAMLHSEHTWGLSHAYHKHQLPDGEAWEQKLRDGLPTVYKQMEESWAEHRSYIDEATTITDKLLSGNLQQLARSVGVAGKRSVVFNPLPWARSGVVEIDGQAQLVKDVPAGGYLTVTPVKADAPAAITGNVLENDHFKLTLAPDRAAIVSLIDKSDGRELVAKDAEFGFGEYLYQQFSRAEADHFRDTYTRNRNPGFGKNWLPATVPHLDARPAQAKWTLTHGQATDTAEASCPAGNGVPHATRLKITLYQYAPILDLEVFIDGKTPTPRPEAGWICLPFAIDQPSFRLGRPGGVADPAKDFVTGSNRHLIALESGLTVTGADGNGVGVCSPDSPVVSLDKPGAWEYSQDFIPRRSNVYVHLFNNMWSTNFPLWLGGSWSAKVRLWPTGAGDLTTTLITPATETRHPLLAATVDGPAGKLPPSHAGVELSRKGIEVTAFGANPDGKETLLRLWEHAGQAGTLTVTVPGNYTSAVPVNLRGQKSGEPIRLQDGKFTTSLPAFAPASFLLVR